MNLRRIAPLLAIPLLAIPALWPLFVVGLTASADGMLHLLRLGLIDSHVRQGVLYPRWLPDLVLGYGYPLLNFYGPAAYYVAESLHLLGLSLPQAILWSHVTFVVLAGWGMYLMALDLLPRRAGERPWPGALVAATAYMYGPYLLTNLFLRGAIAEVAAQALLPWIFWSMRRVYRRAPDTLGVLLAACSLGGLAATHNITLLFLPPVLLGYLILLYFADRRPVADRRRGLGWTVLAGLLAMGISAFFWLPLVVERGYLTDIPFQISATFIAENVWTWSNFLDWRWPFEYSLVPPFQLGFVQLGLGLLGFLLVRPRRAEWWYWAGVFVVLAIGISTLTLDLWLNVKLLLIAQFPWRLLGIASVPLALFAGGVVMRLRPGWPQAGAAAGLLLVIILGQRPLPGEFEQMVTRDAQVTPANAAQFEQDTKAYGTSMASEFFPRWADDFNVELLASNTAGDTAGGPAPQVSLRSATPFGLAADLDVAAPTVLHLASFSFPGWQVALDGARLDDSVTRTDEGLLAVPLPAGRHRLEVKWAGTLVQHAAVALTLSSWLILVLLFWFKPPGAPQAGARRRWWVLAPLAGLGLSAGILLTPPSPASNLQPPQNPLTSATLQLLGVRTWRADEHNLLIYPYWLASAAPEDVAVTWTLTDAAGETVTSMTARPYFNALRAGVWRAPGLADDAYQLALPPDLPQGQYTLSVQLAPVLPSTDGSLATGPALTAPVPVAAVDLDATPPAPLAPATTLEYQFSPQVTLAGYDLAIQGRSVAPDPAGLVVRPGDEVVYTLYWRGDMPLAANYHTLLHWVDTQQQPLIQRDQLPGPWVKPPQLWQPGVLQPDIFRLVVPDDAPSGIYTPLVGLYLTASASPDGQVRELGSRLALPAVKVVNAPAARPAVPVAATLGDWARLEGYTLAAPAVLNPGDLFTVTLFYQANAAAPGDLTQFVQLYSPGSGMAAQLDAPPQSGANPTSRWAPGERIVDVLPLQVRSDTPPGPYRLQIGFYAPQTGERVPVTGADGAPLADNQVILTELQVGNPE